MILDVRPATARRTRTRDLLACGVLAGPVFAGVAALQVLTRDGFDLGRHPLSLLSLGDLGWIQIANFVLAGLLCTAAARGLRDALRHGRGGTWAPRLVGLFGAGLVIAGVFRADPSLGYPVGAPAGNAAELSWHAAAHGVGMMVGFPALVAACLVLARRYAEQRRRGWAVYSVATALAAPVLIAWPSQDGFSVRLAVASLVAFGWLTAVTAHHRAGHR